MNWVPSVRTAAAEALGLPDPWAEEAELCLPTESVGDIVLRGGFQSQESLSDEPHTLALTCPLLDKFRLWGKL